MKKVLIDLTVLKHINCGLGQIAYNYARYFGENASKMDFEIHLLLPKKYIGAFGDDIYYHNCSELVASFPKLLLPKFDIWHSMHQMCRMLPQYKSTTNILTIHDINFIYEKQGQSLYKHSHKFMRRMKRADRIFCISNFTKNDVLKHFPTDKPLEVIYNGVEFGNVTNERKPDLPFPDYSKFLFSIGQIRWKKNFHVLLDAMKLMPEYNLVIAGEKGSDYADLIEKKIKTDKIRNVFLIGTVHDSEKIWLYNHCEAFVFPSLFEGFGLPVIEAMSYGKPVVSSDKTSLKEICSGHAFLLENFEGAHIADTIRKAIKAYGDDPQLSVSSESYARSYSYERHMEQYIQVYKSILEGEK